MVNQAKVSRDLFDFMIKGVSDEANRSGLPKSSAFMKWFANLAYDKPMVKITDGSGDGKIDAIIQVAAPHLDTTYIVLNSKFTNTYNKVADVSFYDEVLTFRSRFFNEDSRKNFLGRTVRKDLKSEYSKLFRDYDKGFVELMFITNCKKNAKQFGNLENLDDVIIYHLEDILLFVMEYMDNAMPHAPDLIFSDVAGVLDSGVAENNVSTSVFFPRVIDYINYYYDRDPYDLLFSRNVRYDLGLKGEVNKGIGETFENQPNEFVYSNNGITLVCDDFKQNPAGKEIVVKNPRVVNGSQTLHSVRNIQNPSKKARIMTKIHCVSHRSRNENVEELNQSKNKLINIISRRTNLQNPIKSFDLCSNDDFQYAIARYFSDYGIYYERRTNEWSQRKIQLKSLNYEKRVPLRRVMQILASVHNGGKSPLGPAAAKRVKAIFEKEPYDAIVEKYYDNIDKVHLLYLVHEVISGIGKKLKPERVYFLNIFTHGPLMVFACIHVLFKNRLTEFSNEDNIENYQLISLVKKLCAEINKNFISCKREMRKNDKAELIYSDYFKNKNFLNTFLDDLPRSRLKKHSDKVSLNN